MRAQRIISRWVSDGYGLDILFIATQVARAAGLKSQHASVGNFKRSKHCKLKLNIGEIFVPYTNHVGDMPKADNGRAYHAATTLMNESDAYQMLLGYAPASEPFRKWVTEVVLPSIRKTGKFDVNEAQDDTSKRFAGLLQPYARQATLPNPSMAI